MKDLKVSIRDDLSEKILSIESGDGFTNVNIRIPIGNITDLEFAQFSRHVLEALDFHYQEAVKKVVFSNQILFSSNEELK